MTKPFIKICTPFYNEWEMQRVEGGMVPIRNKPPLPVEESIDKLAQMDGFEHYESGMVVNTPDFTFCWMRVRGTYIARSRNALVNNNASTAVMQKIPGEYTHILQLDADIEFTYEDICKLLSHDLPIVSGAYLERVHTAHYTGGWFNDDRTLRFIENASSGLQKVDWVGAGFLLVKREVFEKTPYKWFDCVEMRWTDEKGVEHIESFEDDTTFCMNVRKAGFEVWLGCDTVVKHHLINKPKGVKMDRIKELKAHVFDIIANMEMLESEKQKTLNEIRKLSIDEQQKAQEQAKGEEPKGE